jgi:putative molybdopterin biosynthesis protein
MGPAMMLTVKEAASYLKINEKMIYTLVAEKKLPATKITGKWLFSKALIDQWLLAHTKNAPPSEQSQQADEELLIITGSNDILLDRLIFHYNQAHPDQFAVFGNMGSMGGIQALKKKRCDIATSHLVQEDEQDYNFAFIDLDFNPPPAVINFCRREQGILLPPGNPRNIKNIADLAQPGIRIVNRALGTGTRLLLDRELGKAGLKGETINGYRDIVGNHLNVGIEILQGKADAGPAIKPVATLLGLDFLPLRWERYDFLINKERFFAKVVQLFLGLLSESFFRETAATIAGYDTSMAGHMIYPLETG